LIAKQKTLEIPTLQKISVDVDELHHEFLPHLRV